MKYTILALFALFWHLKTATAYKAAVFEHYATTSDSPKDTILKNINEYRDFADKAKDQGADILVFPEYGLTTIVEDPQEYAVEISADNDIITELRAIASERQVYLVVNLIEKEQEANSKTKYYNTNLVFNRSGVITHKYRKINLFQEPYLTPGAVNQTLNFTADFGVTFGIFTGSDILYQNPSQSIFNGTNVTDIIYPTSLLAVVPYFTPLSVQHGYSVANGVNLLAAAYDRPKESRGGSGIYLADGKIAESYISQTSSSKALIQEVTKISKREERTTCVSFAPFALPGQVNNSTISDYVTANDFPKSIFNYKKLDLSSNSSSTEICHGGFCCTFDVLIDTNQTNSSAVYRLAAYNGRVDYKDLSGNIQVCSLLLCQDDSIDTCGARINGSTRFTKITVKGNFGKNEGTFFRPVSLNLNLEPIVSTTYCDTQNETDSTFVQFQTMKAQQEVLVFGIFGRSDVSAASSIHAYGVLFLVLFSIVKQVMF